MARAAAGFDAMNILEVVSGRGVNGAVMHSLLLSRELAARGHRVTLVCRPEAWIAQELRGAPVDVVHSDLHRWPADELRRIAALASDRAIDVAHTHMSRAHFFGTLLKWFCDIPVVATAHNRRIQPHWMFNDRVIAVSDAVRRFQHTFNRVDDARLHVIAPFVDVHRFAPPPPEARRVARWRLGVDDDRPIVGAVGSLFKEKRIVDLVRAFAAAASAVPEARLVLIGDGPADYVRLVDAECEALGIASSVLRAGSRTDIAELMIALDLFLLTSAEETFSMVVAEAMAVGLPVVTTDAGGVVESVDDGVHGFVVPRGDRRRLVEAIVRLMRDPPLRRRFGAAGRARAVERFSAATQVAKIEAVFGDAQRARRERRSVP
jgi:glycosyltransferase involved in cell wall biosynthesis